MSGLKQYRDDGGADLFSGIDDLLDAGDTQSDVHRRHSRKVKGLESHLCAGLPDALSSKGADCGACALLAIESTNHDYIATS